MARVSECTGTVDRDYGPKEGRWEPAPVGTELQLGHALRTGRNSGALVVLRTGAHLRVEADTLIRFAASVPTEGETLGVEFGAVTLEVQEEALTLRSALGPVRVAPRTRLRIGAANQITRYEVEVGTAVFERDGKALTLEPGRRIAIDIATATLIDIDELDDTNNPNAGRSSVEPESPGVPVPPETTPTVAATKTQAAVHENARHVLRNSPEESEPTHVDLSVPAGESPVVHDPSPPTAVELRVRPPCTHDVRVTLAERRTFTLPEGKTTTATLLPRGRHHYTIACRNEAGREERLRGTIHVLKDPGTAQPPRTPPTTFVDTDGRKYTVLYQNLLPEVQIVWPNAPLADRYKLTISTTSAGPRQIETAAPRYRFPAGQIPEGDHTVTFATRDAAHSSPETTLRIRFDNAAPAAAVDRPQNASFRAGQTIEIAGIALPGWTVTALEQRLPLDEQSRFKAQLVLPENARGLAIRFEHGERGIHYYLRRTGAAR